MGSGLGCCCEEEGAGFSSPTSLLGGCLSLAGRLVTWSAFRSCLGAGPAPSHRFGSWSGRLFSVVCLSLPFLFRSLVSLLKRCQLPSFGSFSSVCITFSFLFYSVSLQHSACGSVHLSVSFCISDWFFSHTCSVHCSLKHVGSVKVWFWSCVLSVRQWALQTCSEGPNVTFQVLRRGCVHVCCCSRSAVLEHRQEAARGCGRAQQHGLHGLEFHRNSDC